jgi:hypothetical protein
VQSQQLLMESQIFKNEVLAGTARTDHPAEEMSERRDHGKNLSGNVRIEPFAKSFNLQVYDVLASHRGRWDSNPPRVKKQRSFVVQPGFLGY